MRGTREKKAAARLKRDNDLLNAMRPGCVYTARELAEITGWDVEGIRIHMIPALRKRGEIVVVGRRHDLGCPLEYMRSVGP